MTVDSAKFLLIKGLLNKCNTKYIIVSVKCQTLA